jgi:hypothetical protein
VLLRILISIDFHLLSPNYEILGVVSGLRLLLRLCGLGLGLRLGRSWGSDIGSRSRSLRKILRLLGSQSGLRLFLNLLGLIPCDTLLMLGLLSCKLVVLSILGLLLFHDSPLKSGIEHLLSHLLNCCDI